MLLRLRIWTFRYWAFLPNSPFLHNDSLCQDLTLAAEAEPSFLKQAAICNFCWKHSVQRKWAIFEIIIFDFRNEHWTVHRHWECVCSGPGYSKHFQSAVEPHLFANLHTFWPICRILFAGIYQSGIPDTLSPDSYILWKSWRQISINLSFNILAGFCWFITLSTVNLNLAPKLNPDSMERMEGKIQSAN